MHIIVLYSILQIMGKMSNITLSIDKENQKKLRDAAKKERRSISQQVIIMMEYYLENKKKK
ncbi:unnamed protein product [marine sediment metagenome]|uniref:Ribbon-helix-helix protein CopG domain-containing protein n=1 Tax=marine sediment metagenome TaxID=412755 RepID=X1BTT5_9ZZZZ